MIEKNKWLSCTFTINNVIFEVIGSEENGHVSNTLDTIKNTKTNKTKTLPRNEWQKILTKQKT